MRKQLSCVQFLLVVVYVELVNFREVDYRSSLGNGVETFPDAIADIKHFPRLEHRVLQDEERKFFKGDRGRSEHLFHDEKQLKLEELQDVSVVIDVDKEVGFVPPVL